MRVNGFMNLYSDICKKIYEICTAYNIVILLKYNCVIKVYGATGFLYS